MQSLTSRSSNRRRLMRLAGTGATALLAATAVSSAAGAASTPANAPIGATGSVAAAERLEHGGAEPELRPDRR